MSGSATPSLGTIPASALTRAVAALPADVMLALQADETQNPPQLVPRLLSLAVLLEAIIGSEANTVAAGNDPRIVNAAQLDQGGSLPLAGQSLSLGGGQMSLSVDSSGHVTLVGTALTVKIPLPTTDPQNAGQWWNNGQYVCISTGAAS